MNNKQRRTLEGVFRDPISPSIAWCDIESLFRACGAEITEGRGSRIRVELHGKYAVFHRPHPLPVADKGSVRSVRRFLNDAGVGP